MSRGLLWLRNGLVVALVLAAVSTAIVWLLQLSGNRRIEIGQLCQDNPAHCTGLIDGWCQSEQAALVKARVGDSQQPDDHSLYQHLLAADDYEACIERVAAIEPLREPWLKSARVESWLSVQQERKALLQRLQTHHEASPWLLFYRWTRLRDTGAKSRLLALDRRGRLDTSEFRLISAYLYVNFDKATAMKRLESVLQEHPPLTPVDVEIPQQLASYFFEQNMVRRGYLWAQVARRLAPERVTLDRVLDPDELTFEERHVLDTMAKKVLSQITLGRYRGLPVAPRLDLVEQLSLFPALHPLLNLLYDKDLSGKSS